MLRPLFRKLLASRPVRRPRKFLRHAVSQPAVERLEERCLPTVFTVTTAADSGPGSLRQAILLADAQPGLDTIAFAIGDGGVQTLRPATNLPRITDPVILDATTQPGFAGTPLIVLNGKNTTASSGPTIGLCIGTSRSVVRGLVIQGFYTGIEADGQANTIAGNYIGTDDTGTQAVGNGVGVAMWGSNTLLGGSTPADRNLISGNGTGVSFYIPPSGPNPGPALALHSGNRVQGNYIGTDVSGTIALGNQVTGILLANFVFFVADGNLIGGTDPGIGNLISGNGQDGLRISNARDNIVQGNLLGTDITGTHRLANGSYGVDILGGSNNLIGGTTPAARNLISGNRQGGVHLTAANPVQGNWIGTDQTGTAALSNTTGIVVDGSGITVGGTEPGAGNLISGNLNAGVLVTGNQNRIEGNLISGNVNAGILMMGNQNRIEGNTIGLDGTGTLAVPNGFGVYLMAGTNNQVGGLEAGAGNVISGNLTGVVVFSSRGTAIQGNWIGTDATGSQAVGNFVGVDVRGADTLIGGPSAGAGNVISGNTQVGISLSGSGTQVQGNTIGTDSTGTHALANGDGVYVTAGTDRVTVGGSEAGTGNLISGNRDAGVVLSGQGGVVAGNWIGTDRAGTVRLGNGVGVRIDGTSNTVGGTAAGARNLISGNVGQGVAIYGNANVLEGNYIGTDSSGTVDLGNGRGSLVLSAGVLILQGTDNRIGGVTPSAGNLITGSESGIEIDQGRGNVIQGNTIGTDASGTRALANGDGVRIDNGLDNTIGGSVAGAGNLISGNRVGIDIISEPRLTAARNRIQGNFIGTDVSGTVALPNAVGISILDGVDNLVGGVEPGARNVISGNSGGVSVLGGKGNAVQGNYIGTDLSGTRGLGNRTGVEIDGDNSVGGTAAGAGNVIANNRVAGIYIPYTGSLVIQGNYIGTDSTGTQALGNGMGVDVEPTTNLFLFYDILIGGTQAGARNVISGNTNVGIYVGEGYDLRVQGNLIGTDSTGLVALPNGVGLRITSSSDNTIGGTAPGAGNLISGNRLDGIRIGSGTGNVIQGNWIGTDLSGTGPLGNGGNGVTIQADSGFPSPADTLLGGTAPGAGNRIAFNRQNGVLVNHSPRNAIRQNAIFANGGLGIKLTSGGNQMQPEPVLTAASSNGSTMLIQGTLTSTQSTTFTVELFVNTECDPSGFGEGEQFLASLTVATDPSGNAGFTLILALPIDPGQFVTATATDPGGNTSQFSNCVPIASGDSPGALGGGGRPATLPLNATGSGSPSSRAVGNGVRLGEGLLPVNALVPVPSGRDAFFAVLGRKSWQPSQSVFV